MEKTLNFTIDGKAYTLAYTRNTVIATENMGFSISEIANKPIKSLTTLWRGAFLAHHSSLTVAEVDEIFDKVDKVGLLDALIELYKAPVESLFDEENSKNAIKWTMN
jgi:hypothetical protein